MFSTVSGNVRRNELTDFVDVRSNGKIAMKLSEGDAIVGVETCTTYDDVLLTTGQGRCIRFSVGDVRVFKGRDSTGVRGILLGKDDRVISMSIVRHFDATPDERGEYLRRASALRRAVNEEHEEETSPDIEEESGGGVELGEARYADMSAAEQFILTLSEHGFGKRSSSFEYRVSGRGGKGIIAMTTSSRNGNLVASFPVEDDNQIMLVTDGGQVIRCPVDGVRIAGRSTQGVTIFDVADGERVVSVERLSDFESDDEDDDDETSDDVVDGDGETELNDTANPAGDDTDATEDNGDTDETGETGTNNEGDEPAS